MVLVIFMANFAAMTVEPTLTLFLQSLHVPEGSLELHAGVVFAATGLASFLAAPWLGKLGDSYGHRLILSWSLAGATAVYFLQGLVTAPWHLAVLRFLLGLGVRGIVPAANAVIAQMIPAQRRGRGFGWTLSANFWGNVVGPLTGSVIASSFDSQRAVFPVTALIMLLNLGWLLLRVPRRLPDAAAVTGE
ncbi:MAG TPA: MFS transporter [Symbiobacteriaceae bacterium]|nr:MFS transporter [Symbiobacteriaceae bacterium]